MVRDPRIFLAALNTVILAIVKCQHVKKRERERERESNRGGKEILEKQGPHVCEDKLAKASF